MAKSSIFSNENEIAVPANRRAVKRKRKRATLRGADLLELCFVRQCIWRENVTRVRDRWGEGRHSWAISLFQTSVWVFGVVLSLLGGFYLYMGWWWMIGRMLWSPVSRHSGGQWDNSLGMTRGTLESWCRCTVSSWYPNMYLSLIWNGGF